MAAPSKSNGIDTEAIKASTLRDVLDVVDSVHGKKALVLDPTLTGPLGLVVRFSILKDHGIDKVYHLEPSLAVTHNKIIYLCRPQQKNAEMILGMKSHSVENWLSLTHHHNRSNPKQIFWASSWTARESRILRPS
jgi:Sec1 family